MSWSGWPVNPENIPPYPPENSPLWFQMRCQMVLDHHSNKVTAIRYHYRLLRVQARDMAAGELLDRILEANAVNEAEEVQTCEMLFHAEWDRLQHSTSSG